VAAACWQTAVVTVADDPGRKALLRRGFVLEYLTLSWNVAGIVVLALAAVSAGDRGGSPDSRRPRAGARGRRSGTGSA